MSSRISDLAILAIAPFPRKSETENSDFEVQFVNKKTIALTPCPCERQIVFLSTFRSLFVTPVTRIGEVPVTRIGKAPVTRIGESTVHHHGLPIHRYV